MIKNLTIFISIILIHFSFGAQSQVTFAKDLKKSAEYDVILLGGQSNMVGQGKIADLNNMDFENILYYNFGMSPSLKTDPSEFGPEVGIAENLKEHYPDKNFILIKYAIGGSSLLDWSPEYNKEKAEITGHPEYGNMYDSLLTKVNQITEGFETKITALIWMQGARDARIPEAGMNYYNHFSLFINSIRSDLNEPELPVIYGKVNPPKSRYPAVDTVRKAQERINRNIMNTFLINTDDLEKRADNVHYSTEGQLTLGRRFGEKLIEVMTENN